MITKRQENILEVLVRDYINSAQPISSEFLEKKHKFGLSPATLRIEMQKLTDGGYLIQPHTSAGRVPTDRGYRFFVDKIMEERLEEWEKDFEADWQNIHRITRMLAEESSNLVLGYLPEEGMLWKDGWNKIFHEPEFLEAGFDLKLAELINDFEENIKDAISPEVRVYIGRENPFSKIQDFSIITSGVLTILGPKRMDYKKNISLLKSATKYGKRKRGIK